MSMVPAKGTPEPPHGFLTASRPLGRVLGALGLCALPGLSWAALVINELLPDPAGSDAGREFVELFNAGTSPESLAGVTLQFANGAEGAVWATRWTGTGKAILPPGGLYLIVDRNWMGTPAGQAEVYLGLQNGPDALRLVRDGLVLDMVGYGPLTDGDMMEVSPAATGTGKSLARRPDGRDSGNNREDFALAESTPGARNFHPYSLEVTAWELDPPSLDRAGEQVRFALEVHNNGIETFPVTQIHLKVGDRAHASLLDRLPAGEKRRLSWIFPAKGAGLQPLSVLVPLPDVPDTLVLQPAWLQVGPADLILNEVLAAPRQGQGEWVEIAARSGSVELEGFLLRDEDGPWRSLPPLRLEPGSLLVVTQDSLALSSWHLENQAHGSVSDCGTAAAIGRQRNLPGWPNLNNSLPDGRDFADRIYLADPVGRVIDHLTLGPGNHLAGGEVETGISLERLGPVPRNPAASNWAPSTAQAGSTPGCPNSVTLKGHPGGGFIVRPRILDPAAGVTTVHFLFTLTGPQAGWELRVFDLWGKLVRDLGGDDLGPGTRDLPWDGRDDEGRPAGPGGYVALLELRDPFGHRLDRARALMVIR